MKDENSVFYHYQKLIQLRKQNDVITEGEYELILPEHNDIFAYIRDAGNEKLLVINNFYAEETTFTLPEEHDFNGYSSSVLLSNYADSSKKFNQFTLRPYESIVYHLKK